MFLALLKYVPNYLAIQVHYIEMCLEIVQLSTSL